MDSEILIRLVIAVGIGSLAVVVYLLVNAWIVRRATGRATLPIGFQAGKPALLYFTSPDCVPCRTQQRPEVEKLALSFMDRLQIIEIDTTLTPALAKAWGVLSLPTTFLVDHTGKPRHVNHGVVRAKTLERQINHNLGLSILN